MNNRFIFLFFIIVAIWLSSRLTIAQEYSAGELMQGFFTQYVERATAEEQEIARMDVLRHCYEDTFLAEWDKEYRYRCIERTPKTPYLRRFG